MSVTKLRIHIEYPLRLKVAVHQAVLADAGFRCERPLAGSPSGAGVRVEVLSSHHRNTGENWRGSLGGQPRQVPADHLMVWRGTLSTYLEPVCCSMSSSNCCFLICIQIYQEAGQVVWYFHLFQDCPQFVVICTVKGFG